MLLRFSDILKHRMAQMHGRFSIAIDEAEYSGRYYGVYPTKVNQHRQILDEVIECGRERLATLINQMVCKRFLRISPETRCTQ